MSRQNLFFVVFDPVEMFDFASQERVAAFEPVTWR